MVVQEQLKKEHMINEKAVGDTLLFIMRSRLLDRAGTYAGV